MVEVARVRVRYPHSENTGLTRAGASAGEGRGGWTAGAWADRFYSPSEESGRVGRETNSLLHGTLDMLVLRTLVAGPMHGYGITTSIEARTCHELNILDSALYKRCNASRMAER